MNRCDFCDDVGIPTKVIFLKVGEGLLEFCEPCGAKVTLQNASTGEEKTLVDIYEKSDWCVDL